MCVVVVVTVLVDGQVEPHDVIVCELDECDELDEPPDVVVCELEDDEFEE